MATSDRTYQLLIGGERVDGDGGSYEVVNPATEQVIPLYMRGALGGSTEIEGMRPGTHTVCATIGGGPMAAPGAQAMKCAQVKIGGGKATLAITVPAPSAP